MRLFTTNRYAAVVATLALFLSLGGTSYAVGTSLAKNSVGSKQIKAGAVHNSDLGSSAVTSSKVKNNSLTGSDISESTLGTVPSASKVGGLSVKKLRYVGTPVSAAKQVFNAGGLIISASCAANANTALTATTTKNASSIYVVVHTDSAPATPTEVDLEGGAFLTSSTVDLLNGTAADVSFISLSYEAPDGTVITGELTADEYGTTTCHTIGDLTVG